MKKIITTIFCLLVSFWAFADPHDCMTKEEATTLAQKILNQYIIDYCDCCDSANPDAEELSVSAKLLYIKAATVVPCAYDAERFSVKITYDFGGAYSITEGTLKGKTLANASSEAMKIQDNVSLNYHFCLKNGKVERLYGMLNQKPSYGTCKGLNRFPTAKEVKDKKYKAFISKK